MVLQLSSLENISGVKETQEVMDVDASSPYLMPERENDDFDCDYYDLENISDVKEMQDVMHVEAEYGESILDALYSFLIPATEDVEFDCDYYEPTKVVFLEEEDESWKDHMFGDKISSPFALAEPLFENMEPSADGEHFGQAGGIAPWALLPGETEDEPHFVVPFHHPLLEHGYSKHYYVTDSARLWVLSTSPEEATADEKATPKNILPEENIPKSILRATVVPERNTSEEVVCDEIDVITVEDEDIPEDTPAVAVANKNETIICKIPLCKIKLKKRSYGQMVKGQEVVDVRAEHNLKEKLRRASLKEGYENLRKCLPSLRQKPRASMVKIVKESTVYMNYLKEEEKRLVLKLEKVNLESKALTAQLKEHVN